MTYFFSMKWPFSSPLSSARDESLMKKESIAVRIAQELKALMGAGRVWCGVQGCGDLVGGGELCRASLQHPSLCLG